MKKYRLITACLLILLAFLLFNIFNRNLTIETFNADVATKEEIVVYDYEIEIVDIGKKEPGFISVKFGVTPQVGVRTVVLGFFCLIVYTRRQKSITITETRILAWKLLYYHAKLNTIRQNP